MTKILLRGLLILAVLTAAIGGTVYRAELSSVAGPAAATLQAWTVLALDRGRALLTAVIGAGSPPAQGAAGGPPARPPTVVQAEPAATGAITETIEAVGSLRSAESVLVRSEITGRVQDIRFTEGTDVTSGALLVALDDSVQRAQLEQARASLGFSRSNYTRYEQLARTSAASAMARDEAFAKLKMDEAAVRLAEAQLSKMRITAPLSGILGLRQVSVGDFLAPGTAIVNLEQIDPIKVDFHVPEIFAPAVRVGQTIRLTVDALPKQAFAGAVLAVDPRVDAGGRNLAVRAVLPNPERKLLPGMFARVVLTLRKREDAVLVPEEAIVPGQPPAVFKVVDGKAVRAPVVLGERQGGRVEIREGVAAGEMIVTAGQVKLGPGGPVRIAAPPAGS